MSHYLIAHLNEGRCGNAQILSGAGIDELHRGAAEASEMGVHLGKYAMGWFDGNIGRTRILWHTGTVPDFSSYMALLPGQEKGMVILVNADHYWMTPVFTEPWGGAAALLAGGEPAPVRFGFIPWAPRGLLLIPTLQIAGTVATSRRLRRWRRDPSSRPRHGRKWVLHILLPLIPNLSLAALPICLRARGMLRFMMLFMPDMSWIALICGGFSGIWAFLRTGLILRTLK